MPQGQAIAGFCGEQRRRRNAPISVPPPRRDALAGCREQSADRELMGAEDLHHTERHLHPFGMLGDCIGGIRFVDQSIDDVTRCCAVPRRARPAMCRFAKAMQAIALSSIATAMVLLASRRACRNRKARGYGGHDCFFFDYVDGRYRDGDTNLLAATAIFESKASNPTGLHVAAERWSLSELRPISGGLARPATPVRRASGRGTLR